MAADLATVRLTNWAAAKARMTQMTLDNRLIETLFQKSNSFAPFTAQARAGSCDVYTSFVGNYFTGALVIGRQIDQDVLGEQLLRVAEPGRAVAAALDLIGIDPHDRRQ